MNISKLLAGILFFVITVRLNAQHLFIKFDGDADKLNVSNYTDFLNGERTVLDLQKIGDGFYKISIINKQKTAIIFNYFGKFSHPYYIQNTHTSDTITLILGNNSLKIENANFENRNIQYFETYLNDLFNQKIEYKRKLELGKIQLDSLEKLSYKNFEKASLNFQFNMFTYVLKKQMKVSDKKMIQWSWSLKIFPIDSELGAMMAFFMVTNTPLWYCAQHTQGNIPFLRIKSKEKLENVIFGQKIYIQKEYADLSVFLKIKHIIKSKAYLGPMEDIFVIIDSLSTRCENSYLKVCYAKLKNGYKIHPEKPSLNSILSGYPFKDKYGNDVYIDSLLGKYILIDFWATWCRPCIASFEKLKKIHAMHKDSLVILSINVDDSHDKMVNFLNKRTDLKWDFFYTGLNESVLSRFDVVAYPHYSILDKSGGIMYKQIDGLNSKELQDLLIKIKQK